jgi:hypothetical protein
MPKTSFFVFGRVKYVVEKSPDSVMLIEPIYM